MDDFEDLTPVKRGNPALGLPEVAIRVTNFRKGKYPKVLIGLSAEKAKALSLAPGGKVNVAWSRSQMAFRLTPDPDGLFAAICPPGRAKKNGRVLIRVEAPDGLRAREGNHPEPAPYTLHQEFRRNVLVVTVPPVFRAPSPVAAVPIGGPKASSTAAAIEAARKAIPAPLAR